MKSWALAAACAMALSGCASLCPVHKDMGKVEIIRDSWGVPNIFSDTDEGAMYGPGYVSAEDRAFQMYYNLRIIQGRSSEILGNATRKKFPVTSIENDRLMRIMGYTRYAERIAARLDPETKTLLQAYCDGVNDYVAQNPDKLSYMFEKYNVTPETWTPADCLLSWWRMGLFFTKSGLRDSRQYNDIKDGKLDPAKIKEQPFDDTAAVVRRQDVSDEWVQALNDFCKEHGVGKGAGPRGESPKFSNGWVAGPNKTGAGAALVSDPQTPVTNPAFWYQAHVCGETINVRGVGAPGCPSFLIGFNENVAWGGTALGVDQVDMFMLKTDADHPNQYLFDGKWRDMKVFKETILVKGGETKELTVRESHLGPIVTEFAIGIKEGDEVAMKRLPIAMKDRATVQGNFAMMRARDIDEFMKANEDWLFPGMNCVVGDSKGNIGYRPLGALPVRSRHALNNGEAAHPGWESKYDWQGILPGHLLPTVVNPERGWIVTANHRPVGSFYPLPTGLSSHSQGHTNRSYRIYECIEDKNVDSVQEVLDIHFDAVNSARRDYVRYGIYLRDKVKADLSPEALKALEILDPWLKDGAKSDLTAEEYGIAAMVNGGFSNYGKNPLVTKYGYKGYGEYTFIRTMNERIVAGEELGEVETKQIDKVLSNAWKSAVNKYGDDPSQWYDKAVASLRGQKLEYYRSLDGYPGLDPEQDLQIAPLVRFDGGVPGGQPAQSYTHCVPLDDIDSAKAIMPFGQSEQPGSKWRTTNMGNWANSVLHPAPISRKAVEKYAVSLEVLKR